jgi:hypothetical protein
MTRKSSYEGQFTDKSLKRQACSLFNDAVSATELFSTEWDDGMIMYDELR